MHPTARSSRSIHVSISNVCGTLFVFLVLLAIGTICPCLALIEEDHLCTLYTFVPFTTNYDGIVLNSEDGFNPGFSHMAAALLAMQQFNDRDPSVVPELGDLQNCPIKFDLNKSLVFDSGQVGHLAADTLLQELMRTGDLPCAIAGPYHDAPAIDLSMFANAAKIPHVVHRAFAPRLLDKDVNEFTSQVYPDAEAMAQFHVAGLQVIGRSDFFTILYPSTELGLSRREALVMAFQSAAGITTWDSENYKHPGRSVTNETEWDSLRDALVRVKERGSRTIIVALEYAEEEAPQIAYRAEELEMNNGDFFWSWLGTYDNYINFTEPMIDKLLDGSFAVDPFGPSSSLLNTILNQSAEFEKIVNEANPIKPGKEGYSYAYPGYFADTYFFDWGQLPMFDAVMSIGIGACLAYDKVDDKTSVISGTSHVEGIRTATFTGATGVVRFQNRGKTPGARQVQDVSYDIMNVLSDGPSFPHFYNGSDDSWSQSSNFTFADGTTSPPLLRNPPNMNYLNEGLRIFGFLLLGTVWLSSIITCAWVWTNRAHRVLMAAQPIFLYALCLGSAVFASGIFCLSFDENQGWTQQQLSSACSAAPWVIILGHVIIYSALFSKLLRVNKVLQFTRRKVSIYAVMWPASCSIAFAIVVLAIWTSLGGLFWERNEINSFTGESMGKCNSHYLEIFVYPLAVVAIVPMILTGLMAWKTRDVDDVYSESKWIFVLIVLQLELCLLGAPVITILRGLSTTGRYVGFVIMIWAFPISTLVMIMLPKVLAFRQAVQGGNRRGKRGERRNGSVQVSGISSDLRISASSGEKRYSKTEIHQNPPSNDCTYGTDPLDIVQHEQLERISI